VTTGEAGAKKCTRGFDSGDRDNARENMLAKIFIKLQIHRNLK